MRELQLQHLHGNLQSEPCAPIVNNNGHGKHDLCNKGHRSPCRRRTGEPRWSDEQSGSWESTSAPRRVNEPRSCTTCTTATSITVSSNWGKSVVWKTTGNCLCATTGVNMTLVSCLGTVLLVHTGHDAEHQGPDDNRKEHSARCIATSITSTAQITVHTNHKAWKLRLADDRLEHSVGSTETRKPARNVPLSMSTTSAAARGAATRKLLFLPLFPSPLRRGRGLRALTPELRGQARKRLLHLPPRLSFSRFSSRSFSSFSLANFLLSALRSCSTSFGDKRAISRRKWTEVSSMASPPPNDGTATSGSHVTDRGCSHLRLGHLLKRLRAASLPCSSSVPVGRLYFSPAVTFVEAVVGCGQGHCDALLLMSPP